MNVSDARIQSTKLDLADFGLRFNSDGHTVLFYRLFCSTQELLSLIG